MVPKLRFKEFCGEWEEKKLGDVCKIYDGTHQTPKYVEKGIKFLSVENIKNIYKSNKYITEDAFKKEFKNNRICNNDILMTRIGDIGTPAIVKTNEYFAYYVSLALLKCNEKINPIFLTQFIQGHSFQSELWKRTLHIAFPKKINKGEIGECKISIPSLPEQTKIADFLSTVDDKIQNQQDKITHLENIKKGFMQKIFSRKIRFKDDNGNEFPEWEENKLGDLGSFYGGLSGKNKEDFIDGNKKYITYMNVYKNIFINNSILENVQIGIEEKQNTVKYGDIIFTQSSETVEEVGLSSVYLYNDEPLLNSFCMGFHISNLHFINPLFIGYLMRSNKIRKYIMKEGQGISRINLSGNRLLNMVFKLPCLEEQNKIADFLSLFDEKIDVEKETLEHLKELKKGLLQQMFV